MTIEDDVHTTIRIHGPGLRATGAGGSKIYDIRTAGIDPVRGDPRFSLSLRSLGQLERLAKARFMLQEMLPGMDPARLDDKDADIARSIILTVFASSEIEGEGVSADDIEPFVTAQTEPGEHVNQELLERLRQKTDIFNTYKWALGHKVAPVLSYEFVLDIHRRMFENTSPAIAGKMKTRDVHILWKKRSGEEVRVSTVPAPRAEECLRALCNRTSGLFQLARDHAEASMLIAAAEFACDFLAIHPFEDGNGRTARLLSTYLLERGGYHFTTIYPLDQVILDTRSDYYEALNMAQSMWHSREEDLTPWVRYFVNAVFQQWERAFSRIREKAATS